MHESPEPADFCPRIAAVGLATAQGGAARLAAAPAPILPPAGLHWPRPRWAASRFVRPALGIDAALEGRQRWAALARLALEECGGLAPAAATSPLVLASCNGCAPDFESGAWRGAFDSRELLAGTPWAGRRLPVASAACASGAHGLYLARRLLAAGHDEVFLLAADILSPAAQANFEALRILSEDLEPPWQPATEGFLCGEAAVALRLRRDGAGLPFAGPALGQDLGGAGGLSRALGELGAMSADLISGQGTGPASVDREELASLRRVLPDLEIPLTTPLYHFGHCLGAASLLGLALAALPLLAPGLLAMPEPRAADGRRLAGPLDRAGGRSLVVCRALGGACAALLAGENGRSPAAPRSGWAAASSGRPWHPLLRRLADEAPRHRPAEPPDLLIVRLAEPLLPPPRALLGGRLLPSAVLEITPGRVAQEIAASWGFGGAALCLVGGDDPPWLAGLLAKAERPIPVVYMEPGRNHVDWQSACGP
jgi:hypothetical protein